MYFRYFVIITPWKRAGPFIWKKINPHYPRMLFTKFGWNWFSGYGEEDIFFNFVNVFCYIVVISPWKRAGPSFEQTWIPITQGWFVPSLVEIGSVVSAEKIFLFRQCIFIFRNYLPLEKGVVLYLNRIESPLSNYALCQVWLKLVPWSWRRR